MLFNIRFQYASAFGAVGHVKLQYPRLPPQRADLFRHRFGVRHAAAAVYHNVEAVLCQGQSRRTADTAGGAGDEDGLGHDEVPLIWVGGGLKTKRGKVSAKLKFWAVFGWDAQHADCTCEPDLSEWLGGCFGISLPFHVWMALKSCFQVACGGLRPSESRLSVSLSRRFLLSISAQTPRHEIFPAAQYF